MAQRPPASDGNWSPPLPEGGSNHKAGVGKGRPGEAQVPRGQGTDGQESIPRCQEGVGRKDCRKVKALSPLSTCSIVPLDFT